MRKASSLVLLRPWVQATGSRSKPSPVSRQQRSTTVWGGGFRKHAREAKRNVVGMGLLVYGTMKRLNKSFGKDKTVEYQPAPDHPIAMS